MKKKEKKSNVARVILNVLIIIVSCVLIFCIYKLGSIWWEYHSNQQTQEKVQDIFYGRAETSQAEVSGENSSGEQTAVTEGFSLKPVIDANPDAVGWIKVEDTQIDYAVMQGENNDQYLYTGFFGEENNAGSVFMDYRNTIGEPLQNLILYGHRMKDGSMFGELGDYLDYGFYQNHPQFTFITEDGIYDCLVFSVYQCTTSVDYCQPVFSSAESMEKYIQDCKDRSIWQTPVSVTAEDTIITLSTCDYVLDPDEGRLVVHAKLQLRNESSETNE